jgi:hypothetical protein
MTVPWNREAAPRGHHCRQFGHSRQAEWLSELTSTTPAIPSARTSWYFNFRRVELLRRSLCLARMCVPILSATVAFFYWSGRCGTTASPELRRCSSSRAFSAAVPNDRVLADCRNCFPLAAVPQPLGAAAPCVSFLAAIGACPIVPDEDSYPNLLCWLAHCVSLGETEPTFKFEILTQI